MTTTPTSTITDLDASALSQAIHARTLSCREVMTAYLARIHALNPRLNAIVNLAPDAALLAQADACDAELAQGRSRGWLHGIPQAIKDTGHALGFPSTVGCSLLKDVMPTQDSVMTARMKAAGCIVIGKTNMPELGLGSHTFNDLFGATPSLADAMYAPVATRFVTYDVKLDRLCADYCETILNLPGMLEWAECARTEKDGIEELEAEF